MITESLYKLPEISQSALTDLDASTLEALAYRVAWVSDEGEGHARPDQLPPDMEDTSWFTWLQLGGRGSGKTRTGTEWVWQCAYDFPGCRIAVVAPTSSDVRKTCFEGESGILAKAPASFINDTMYNRQELVIRCLNGSQIFGYSADAPDRLRGPQHNFAWCDELAAWQYLNDTLDNLLMGLRLGKAPRVICTTTPRPIKRLKEILADPTTRTDRVSTYANAANLPEHFIKTILRRYEGTRLGRQELLAEIVDEVPGALWTHAQIDTDRVKSDEILPDMAEVVVAVDPSVSSVAGSDECGIVVAGRGTDGIGYVLQDSSMAGSPSQWAIKAVEAYDYHNAGFVVYESNQGGEMVAETLKMAAATLKAEGKRDTDFVAMKDVWASRGKVTRAEPVSALYEQHRIRHVGMFSKLEDQMAEFTSDFDRKKAGYSPDRVDALVWAVTRLFLGNSQSGVMEYYRQEVENEAKNNAKPKQLGSSPPPDSSEPAVLVPPPGVHVAICQGAVYRVLEGKATIQAHHVQGLLSKGWSRK